MSTMRQLPGLLKQEREAISCSLTILFRMQRDERLQGGDVEQPGRERLLEICKAVLRSYVKKDRLLREQTEASAGQGTEEREACAAEVEREVSGLVPIVCNVVLQGIRELDRFDEYALNLFPVLCELTEVSAHEVRVIVRDILVDKITPLLKK